MAIVNSFNAFYLRNKQAGEDGIKVYCTNCIHFSKQQKEKQPDIIFGIKYFSFIKKTLDSFLAKYFFFKGQGRR